MAEWLSLSGEASPSVVELVGQRLIEQEFWDWFGLGGIEGRSLVEEKVPLRRPTSGRDRGRCVRELEVLQNGHDHDRVGEGRWHLCTTSPKGTWPGRVR